MADIIVVGADGVPVKAKDMGDGTFQIASQTTVSAGTSLMGKVGIDQTTPGVTNGVSVVGSLANGAVVVTPSDTVDLTTKPTKGLYVGGSGDISLIMSDGTTVTFTALSSGVIHPLSVNCVKATGTTATTILAVY